MAIDLVRNGRRVQRLFLPGLLPGGDPGTIAALAVEGEPYGGIDVRWVNPNSGRLIFHSLTMSRTDIQYFG